VFVGVDPKPSTRCNKSAAADPWRQVKPAEQSFRQGHLMEGIDARGGVVVARELWIYNPTPPEAAGYSYIVERIGFGERTFQIGDRTFIFVEERRLADFLARAGQFQIRQPLHRFKVIDETRLRSKSGV